MSNNGNGNCLRIGKLKLVVKKVDELIPHQMNKKLFDEMKPETKAMLKKSVNERGVLHTIVLANDEKTILSGHQRWLAAKERGYESVPCIVVTDVAPDSPEAVAIMIESNLAQRIITAEIYTKCMEVYEGLPTVRERELQITLKKIHPAYRQYLQEGKLPLRFAHSLSCMPLKEQEQYRDVVELVVKGQLQIKDASTEELRKLKKKNQELINKIKEAEERLKRIQEKHEKERKEKERLAHQVEELSSEKERLRDKLSQLEENIEQMKLKPSPEAEQKLKRMEKQVEKYKAEAEQKEKEMALLREELEKLMESLDSTQEQLDKERNRGRELERKLQEETKKIRDSFREQKENNHKTKLSAKAQFLTEYALMMVKEIHGMVDDFSAEERNVVVERLSELVQVVNDVKSSLLNSAKIKYAYNSESDKEKIIKELIGDADFTDLFEYGFDPEKVAE